MPMLTPVTATEFNATAYGADPTGVKDSAAGIQAAIQAAQAVGGTVALPPGKFAISSTLKISKSMKLRGAGPGTILVKTKDVVGIQVESGADGVSLEDFTLDTAVVGRTMDGIVIGLVDTTNGAGNCVLRSLQVTHQGGHGINVVNGNSGLIESCSTQANLGHGVCLDSKAVGFDNTNAWTLVSVSSVGNRGDGIHLGVAGCTVAVSFDVEGNAGYGLYVNRPYCVLNGYTEGNVAGPAKIDSSCYESVITLRSVAGQVTINNSANKIILLDGTGKFTVENQYGTYFRKQAAFNTYQTTVSGGGSVTIPGNQYNHAIISITDGNPVYINAPSSVYTQMLTLTVKNAGPGALGVVTFAPAFKLAAFRPPSAGHSQSIIFLFDGVNWTEISRTSSDVPN